MSALSLLALLLCPASAALPEPDAERLIALRQALHREPELGNRERKTMKRLESALRERGIGKISSGVAKTGLLAVIEGSRPGRTIALRAPIDGFPVPDASSAPYRSIVPGVSHACGHDALAAALVGAGEILHKSRESWSGSVVLIFQPAEEGTPDGEEGGAALMVKEKALKGVKALIAAHVDSDLPLGTLGYHEGTVYAGADTVEIDIAGEPAHGATPWKGVDAAAVAAQTVSALQLIASRQSAIWDPVVLTIGTIRSGVRGNALAGEAKLTGTLRSYSQIARAKAQVYVRRVAENVAEAFGATAVVRFTESIGPVVNSPALAPRLAAKLQALQGAGKVRALKPMSYADDVSAMTELVPSFYFQIGVRDPSRGFAANTHTGEFDVPDEVASQGARLMAELALETLSIPIPD